jgi:CheY-specific phosphatase CheX
MRFRIRNTAFENICVRFLGSNGDVEEELNGGPEHESESDIVSNITEQLQAVNPEDRVCGLQSLANLTARAAVRELVMRGRLVRVVGPLLLDGDEMVRQAAAGALRYWRSKLMVKK